MFVEFEEARSWYTAALDGLRYLETALHTKKEPRISESVLDQIYGMSSNEWREFLRERELEHEMFASLALLASFEGNIRRDADWRGSTGKAMHHQRFRAIPREHHVPLSKLFELWESTFARGHPLRKQFLNLRQLYGDRNIIAHGKAHKGQFAFELIFARLEDAKRKWREFVEDFDR